MLNSNFLQQIIAMHQQITQQVKNKIDYTGQLPYK